VGARARAYACLCRMPSAGTIFSAASLAPSHFLMLSHKWHDFRKKVTEHKMCVLISSTTFIQNISHSKNNLARYCYICENIFMWSTCYFCWILMKLEFSRQRDGHDKANSHFLQFCGHA
jgi:hypothetical protein